MSAQGLLVIVSGPSGVGKTTVCERLYPRPGFVRSISATTRAPRKGEQQGRDYDFFTREAFELAKKENRFLEWARVHDDYYGTPRGFVEANLAEGRVVVLNVDVQGAAQVRQSGLPNLSFFLLPPSLDELRARLAHRGDVDPARAARRLKNAETELARAHEYDHRIVNDQLERAVNEIVEIISRARAERS